MILKNITLINIRSYKSQSIDFPEGSLLLSGDIGAGKSTVLLAAEFALFGIMKGDLSGEDLLRHGSKEGSVELRFEVDGKDVVIKRTLKRGKDSVKQEAGYIIIDGKKDDGTHIELKTAVLDLLGYPKELVSKSKSLVYRYTVYTPQEQMKHILFDDKEERLDVLRRVFGVDKYKRIAENSQIYIRALKEKSKLLEGKTYGLEEKNRQFVQQSNELQNASNKINEIRASLDSARKSAEEKSGIAEEKEKALQCLRELKNEFELCNVKLNEKLGQRQKNSREAEETEKQVSEIRKKISHLDVKEKKPAKEIEEGIREKDRRIKQICEANSEISERIKHLGIRQKELKKAVDDSKEQIERLEKKEKESEELKSGIAQKDSIRKQIKEEDDGLSRLKNSIAGIEAARKNSESIIKTISKLDECPTCFQPVAKEHRHKTISAEEGKIRQGDELLKQIEKQVSERKKLLEGLDKKIEEIHGCEKRFEKLGGEIKLLRKAKEGMDEKRKELVMAENELSSANRRSEELQREDIGRISKELENEKALLKRMQEKIHLEEMLAEKTARNDELSRMQDEIKNDIEEVNRSRLGLQEKMKSLGDAEGAYLKAKKELDSAKEGQKKIEIEERGLVMQADGMKRMMQSLEREINEKIMSRQKLDRARQMQDWLDENFLKVVDIVEKKVMHGIHSQFTGLFQEWFKSLVEDDALSISLDENFAPLVQQDGYEASLEGLSGGEKTAVALAYRLSLNRVINDVVGTIKTKDLIILDEPTDGFSSEQLDRVKEVIEELNMKQVIIVSHEQKVEGFVDNIVRIQKEGHVSVVGG